MNTHTNRIFNSIDNEHKINISIIDDICWFNIDNFNFKYYKTFLITLKDVMTYLKKNNIIYIKQYIYEEDIAFFKNSSIVNIDEYIYIATTDINIFIDEIVAALGIKKI